MSIKSKLAAKLIVLQALEAHRCCLIDELRRVTRDCATVRGEVRELETQFKRHGLRLVK